METAARREFTVCAVALVLSARLSEASSPSVAAPFTQFAATLMDGEVEVDCQLAPTPESARLVIMYRTDGVCPADATDGSTLADVELPSDKTTFTVKRKLPREIDGAAACFTAIASDRSGAALGRVTTGVHPPDPMVPEPVKNLRRAGQP
jgi:hypothetical protein